MSIAAPPTPASEEVLPDGGQPGPRGKELPIGVKRGGWFVRIAIIVVVLIWLLPTIGVLVTSFRPEQNVDTTGWWTVLAHPLRAGEWTLDNYRDTLDANGFSNALLNSLAVAIPATVIPITIAAFAAYAFSWMQFRGRYVLFVLVVGLLVVPLQMALIPILRLYAGGASIGGLQIFPDLDLNGTFIGSDVSPTSFTITNLNALTQNVDYQFSGGGTIIVIGEDGSSNLQINSVSSNVVGFSFSLTAPNGSIVLNNASANPVSTSGLGSLVTFTSPGNINAVNGTNSSVSMTDGNTALIRTPLSSTSAAAACASATTPAFEAP
jgi:hypothetical protein